MTPQADREHRGGDREWRFVQSTVVAVDARTVWRRVVSQEGINDEMWPWMTMSPPRGAGEITVDSLRVGEPLGRAWLRLFGLVPFDYDALTITVLERGRRFREESTMLSLRRWVHDRTVEPEPGGGARVTDRVTLAPRAPLVPAGPLLRAVLAAFFRHRHRRLARHVARSRADC
jgi:hypothetical protein